MAYFQAYTNTHAEIETLEQFYAEALREEDVVGISVGTRPDCVPPKVLDLLASLQAKGKEVWLELGLQSSFDSTLDRVNRGHHFEEYRQAVCAARDRGLPVCTHLIIGLPGENALHSRISLDRVLELGVDGLKLHPLHVVKNTRLAKTYMKGDYTPLTRSSYISQVVDLIERTPKRVIFHRVTGTSPRELLVAPAWCTEKWRVINGIEEEFALRGSSQGSRLRRVDSIHHNLHRDPSGFGTSDRELGASALFQDGARREDLYRQSLALQSWSKEPIP